MKATQTLSWKKLQEHSEKMREISLDALFAQDPCRAQKMRLRVGGIEADFSRHQATAETLALLQELAREQGFEERREEMFKGDILNITEGRAVLHTALRAQSDAPVYVAGQDVLPALRETQKRMKSFVHDVRSGAWLGASGEQITDIVNIGIGGSDLGPRLVVGALRDFTKTLRVHFVANVDPCEIEAVLSNLDPARTLFIIVSKTFSTQETLLNARAARSWLTSALGEGAAARHFVAVSSQAQSVKDFGIEDANRFEMWDWVGGRYSLWSAVGLAIALALGWDGFMQLLKGASLMDAHFYDAPLDENLPFLIGALGVWQRNFRAVTDLAVLPYSERLRDLPRFLQQLDMESNGKSVTREGEAVDYQTGPVVFGECGSVGQHSFHQWLHQGTGRALADFIGVREGSLGPSEAHTVLCAHMLAQIQALQSGRAASQTARVNAGNKPSNVFWLDRLDPMTLGALLAFYEHKVFVQGVLWGINSFDQFGVELGKELAGEILKAQKPAASPP